MYSRRNNQRDGFYRSRSNSGFQNQNFQPMMGGQGQGQILVKGPGGRVQLMAPEQNFFSNYNCNDIIYAAKEMLQLGIIGDIEFNALKITKGSGSAPIPVTAADFKYKDLRKMIEMQKATGGNAGETFNQLAGFGKPRFTLSELTQSIMSDFQNSVNGDILRMEPNQFAAYSARFKTVTSKNLASKKCPRNLIVLVLDKIFELIQGDLGIDEYEEAVFDGRRRRRRRRKSLADGRKRRRSKRSKRSRKSRSKSDGKRRSRKSRSKKSKKSRSRRSRSRRSRSKHMSAKKVKKILKMLRKL